MYFSQGLLGIYEQNVDDAVSESTQCIQFSPGFVHFPLFKTEKLKELRGLVSYLLRFSDKLTLDGFCSQLNLTGTLNMSMSWSLSSTY